MQYEGIVQWREGDKSKYGRVTVDTSDDVEAIRLLQAYAAIDRARLIWATVEGSLRQRVVFTG